MSWQCRIAMFRLLNVQLRVSDKDACGITRHAAANGKRIEACAKKIGSFSSLKRFWARNENSHIIWNRDTDFEKSVRIFLGHVLYFWAHGRIYSQTGISARTSEHIAYLNDALVRSDTNARHTPNRQLPQFLFRWKIHRPHRLTAEFCEYRTDMKHFNEPQHAATHASENRVRSLNRW